MRKLSLLLVIFVFSSLFAYSQSPSNITQGALFATDEKGKELGACPLKHTSVKADVSGFLTRVTVTQEFENNFSQPIEAVYTFPLSQNSAVDQMTMQIGERTIRGKILKKEEARKVYETAKAEGKTASLLDQQRPNIFTQSVANILPNEKILIEISYVETLKYEDGVYEFVFPMVVGPRYIPNSVKESEAKKLSPPVAKTRAGHDISMEVNLNAGVPVEEIRSTSHEITTTNLSPNAAKITLRNETEIPNKDFILRFDVTGKKIEDAVLLHRSEKGGFFSLILSPPENYSVNDITPKEIVFVLDTSGSMSGFPIVKAKEAMKMSLEGLNPQDTFNLITFAGDTSILFNEPVAATPQNLARAKEFLESKRGAGGTEMMKAIKAALDPTKSQKHLRIVCFMTDGYVGNEAEILSEIQKHPNARIFSFGIGSSVNRFLLDKMAEEGRGEVEYVSLQDDGSAAAKRFYERVRTPLLTDISIDWNGLPVADVYPKRNPDLFSAKPIVVNGRFTKAASGTISLKGKVGGQVYTRNIAVNFPETESKNDVLATLWARKRIDELMREDYSRQKPEIREQITQLGLEFRLLTQFTSFVAVEERIVNENGQMKRVEVPVELPEDVNRETTIDEFGASSRDPHGYISQGFIGRRDKRVGKMNNSPANVVGLTVTTNTSAGSTAAPPTLPASKEPPATGTNAVVDVSTASTAPATNASGSVLSAILNRLEAHKNALKSFKADVKIEKYDSTLSESALSEGTLKIVLAKEQSVLRIDLTKPAEEITTIAGGRFVSYRPLLKQAITGSPDQTRFPYEFLTLPKDELKKKYDFAYIGQENIADSLPTWHLEILPKQKDKLAKTEIWIDANGMIVQMKVTESNGDWKNILFSNVWKNLKLDASEFTLNLPKDVKIINNR